MSVRIVHISDVHFDQGDDRVKEPLLTAIKEQRPDFIVFTGDLVTQPWPKNVKAAKQWLEMLATDSNVSPEKLLVIPGNHDYGFWGSFGVSFVTGRAFRKAFKNKRERQVFHFGDEHLIFVHIDSNPRVLDLARGHVSSGNIRRLKKELSAISKGVRDACTKIALIHHHCLPVYNEQTGDRYLLLKNSHAVIEFLADFNINLVLHGHKHRATHSLLSIGGVGIEPRVIEILAAGTAIKQRDFEDRGHNFNLIAIDESGFRSTTQFFSKPVGERFIPADRSYGFARESLEQLYQARRAREKFAIERIHWSLVLNIEGDRYNEMQYRGFRSTLGVLNPPVFAPPAYTVDTGSIPGAWIDTKHSDTGIKLIPLRNDRKLLDFQITFDDPPTREKHANFTICSWDLNASSLNEEQFSLKFPGRSDMREYEEKEIQGAIEHFSWEISFPEKLKVTDVKFEVFDGPGQNKQTKLTELLKPSFYFSATTNSAILNLYKPPAEYRYRISWQVPPNAAGVSAIPVNAKIDLNNFKRRMLAFRDGDPTNPSDNMLRLLAILKTYKSLVIERVAAENNTSPNNIRLEASIMIYDETTKPGMLRTVARTTMADLRKSQFSLEIGDGNAGRAYKTNLVRMFFAKAAVNDRFRWYIPGSGKQHEFLCSIPLHHLTCPLLLMGILNISTFDSTTAEACQCLNNERSIEWLLQTAHDGGEKQNERAEGEKADGLLARLKEVDMMSAERGRV